MGRALQWCLLLLAAELLLPTTSELLDRTMIYRLHEDPPRRSMNSSTASTTDLHNVDLELHTRTNALGMLFKYDDGSYEDPAVGSPALGCVHASSSCAWLKLGWTRGRMDMANVLPRILFNYKDNSSRLPLTACSVDNGGCQHSCRDQGGRAECLCPTGYSLTNDRKGCTHYGQCNHFLFGTGGSFSSPNHPGKYSANLQCSWLLATSPGQVIKLMFTSFSTESRYDWVEVYDGDTKSSRMVGKYMGTSLPSPVTSTGNMLLVYFRSDASNSDKGFAATFTTESTAEPVLVLTNNKGSLHHTLFDHPSNGLCMSVIYKLAPDVGSEISIAVVLPSGSEHNLTQSKVTEVGAWNIGRFQLAPAESILDNGTMVNITVVGKNSAIFSIVGCNPDEDEDVLLVIRRFVMSTTSMGPTSRLDYQSQGCRNGGSKDPKSQKCICPAGFIGDSCEEGCGPNRYGSDCGGICSGFEHGCRRMILCRPELPFWCAPGFKGLECDVSCSDGEYGVSCRSSCGRCSQGDTCDQYTGKCPGTCSPGYRPPLCQARYKHFTQAPTVRHVGYNSTTVVANLSQVDGDGTPRIYQLQYKVATASDWISTEPELISSKNVTSNITGLRAGVRYEVRFILFDRDGNSYDGDEIPLKSVLTLCKVPDSVLYNVTSSNITSRSFDVSWQYNVQDPRACPVTNFEVELRDRWRRLRHLQPADDFNVSYVDLLPGRRYSVRLRAVAANRTARYSEPVTVTTSDDAPAEVVDLMATPAEPDQLRVSWNPPRFTAGTIRRYHVQYQCVRLLACANPCSSSRGALDVTSTAVTLGGLLPHAQYTVRVAGVAASVGPYRLVQATTNDTGASIGPDPSGTPVLVRTNTTTAVQWRPPSNCSSLNGFFREYRYQLTVGSKSNPSVLLTGSTTGTNVTFSGLTPHTDYQVLVFLVTSGGWNRQRSLVIDAPTSATVSEKVQDLMVYKKGRRMIGVRWAPPRETYGSLKSFTVSYRDESQDVEVGESIEPMHCVPWPELYCHTFERLVPDTVYHVTVRARNHEVDADGAPETTSALTKEGAPGPPVALRVSNVTQNSFVLEWEPPRMINGVLRSFIVNVEETDSVNSSDCCAYFPVQELPVRAEEQLHQLEVNGLGAASTFTVSISAKTVTMGPTVNLTVSTTPEQPVLLHTPQVASDSGSHTVSTRLRPEQPGLDSTYLLLVLPSGESPDTDIWDEDVAEQLRTVVGQRFYVAGQYHKAEIDYGQQISFGTGAPSANGTLSNLEDPPLTPGETYKVGFAVVLEYCNQRSVGFLASSPFVA